MLSYGQAALFEIFQPSQTGITYCQLVESQWITLNLVGWSTYVCSSQLRHIMQHCLTYFSAQLIPLNLYVQLPQHHCQTVDYFLFHFRYPKNYYPLNQTFWSLFARLNTYHHRPSYGLPIRVVAMDHSCSHNMILIDAWCWLAVLRLSYCPAICPTNIGNNDVRNHNSGSSADNERRYLSRDARCCFHIKNTLSALNFYFKWNVL